ncbi:hypothetical protein ACFY05_32870 [Microtetraspora fusca]|uniref:Uncharacterized protein n=1 Tax=Microtetraspora fusca TaxID=1997 RepID=A0ABW6VE44_MICFU
MIPLSWRTLPDWLRNLSAGLAEPALALLRPYCWTRGYHTVCSHPDSWFETCTLCHALVWSQVADEAHPDWPGGQAQASWRRLLSAARGRHRT